MTMMLRLTRLNARQLNGFREQDRIVIDGLTAGLNIVYAPNRAGKTTLTFAYRLALSEMLPSKIYDVQTIDAVGMLGDIEVTGTIAHGTRQGTMPTSATSARYVMHLPDLIGGLPQNDREAAQRALLGYPLSVTKPPAVPQGDTKTNDIRQTLLDVQKRARQKDGDRTKAEALEIERLGIIDAKHHVFWLVIATEQLRIETLKQQYPGIEQQTQDANANVQRLQVILTHAVEHLAAANDALFQCTSDRTLSSGNLTDGEQTQLIEWAKEIYALSGMINANTTAEHIAKTSLASAAMQLGEPYGEWDNSRGDVLPRVVGLVQRADRARETEGAVAALEQAVTGLKSRLNEENQVPAAETEKQFRQLQDLLGALLAKRQSKSVEGKRNVLLIAAAGIGGLSIVGFFPSLAWIGALSGFFAGALAAIAFYQSGKTVMIEIDPMDITILQSALGTGAPKTASEFANALAQAARGAEAFEAKRQSWRDTVSGLEALIRAEDRSLATRFEEELMQLQKDTGLHKVDAYNLAEFMRRWSDWSSAKQVLKIASATLTQCSDNMIERREQVTNQFNLNGYCSAVGVPQENAIKDFVAWFARSKDVRDCQQRRDIAATELEDYFKRIGIPEEGFIAMASEVINREEPASRLRDADQRILAELRHLERDDCDATKIADILQQYSADARNMEEIGIAHGKATATVTRLKDCTDELQAILTDLRYFEENGTVADAKVALEHRRYIRGQKANEYLCSAARHQLIQMVQELAEREGSPELLRLTNAKLQEIDPDLVMEVRPGSKNDEGLGVLMVNDNLRGRKGQRFSELATSTKVNVILATRLALIEQTEGDGTRYPLFVDEIMGVADQKTRQGIARLLAAEASIRQVVFFTNNETDAEAVRSIVKEPVTVITIGGNGPEIPVVADTSPLPMYNMPLGPVEIMIDRSILSHHPRIVLTDSADMAIIGDTSTLSDALRLLSPERLEEIMPIVAAMEALRACIEKTMPIMKWEDISGESWVTATYKERMRVDLAECEGRGDPFLDRIEKYKGIGSSTRSNARTFLEENNYVGIAPPSIDTLRDTAREHLNNTVHAALISEWCILRFSSLLLPA